MNPAPIRNALTVDVEDYFHVSAFASHIARADWDRMPCRVERNVDAILAMLDQHKTHATYFMLGWVAERYKGLVRRIVELGHELASHGYAHQRATEQSHQEFRQDITRAKALLEDISGVAVKGYRAPSFSIGHGNMWALECLREAGYRYSSSIYPIRHDHYGMPGAPRFAFLPEGGRGLLEFPVTTVRLFNYNLPAGGGGYFRLLPYSVSRWCLKRVNTVDRQPCLFYFHPWEVDPEQPRIRGLSTRTKFRHYLNLDRTEARLRRLLADFAWGPIEQVLLGPPT
jgi:polysaccharide deacetylase family protein (PEP-CTERM system associated)